ncbi:hypothetical protein [Paraburkholderia sp. J12]|uniref:hypothetical protein n=1 Tax=Paraburkholderia sp. J12 TaxID=2805432 RepID=UPI002ABDEE32|nr:hypothetical protein [Paraburkholderia sp. J12]
MKLPLLFASLFEDKRIKTTCTDIEPERTAQDAASQPAAQAARTAEVAHHPDALLDGIDRLGELILELGAQLRAERTNNAKLRKQLYAELSTLSRRLHGPPDGH